MNIQKNESKHNVKRMKSELANIESHDLAGHQNYNGPPEL